MKKNKHIGSSFESFLEEAEILEEVNAAAAKTIRKKSRATTVKLSENIISEAKIASKAFNRSLAKQIEHWARIGKVAEENPDLSYEFIKNIIQAQKEVNEQ